MRSPQLHCAGETHSLCTVDDEIARHGRVAAGSVEHQCGAVEPFARADGRGSGVSVGGVAFKQQISRASLGQPTGPGNRAQDVEIADILQITKIGNDCTVGIECDWTGPGIVAIGRGFQGSRGAVDTRPVKHEGFI